MACVRGVRIPEPIRQADKRSRELVKQHYDTQKDKEVRKLLMEQFMEFKQQSAAAYHIMGQDTRD